MADNKEPYKVARGASSGTCNCIGGACTIHPAKMSVTANLCNADQSVKPAQSDAPSAESNGVALIENKGVPPSSAEMWTILKVNRDCFKLYFFGSFIGSHTREAQARSRAKLLTGFIEAYAALRTAQRDAEIAHLKAHNGFLTSNLELTRAKVAQLERELLEARNMEADLHKRLAAAESALSEARERTIRDVEQMADYMADKKIDLGGKAVKVAAYLLGMKLRLTSSASAKGE